MPQVTAQEKIFTWGTHAISIKGLLVPQPVPLTIRIGKVIEAPASSNREELEALTKRCAIEINAMHDLGR